MKAFFGVVVAGSLSAALIGCGVEPATPSVEEVPAETELGGESADPSAMMEDAAPSDGEAVPEDAPESE